MLPFAGCIRSKPDWVIRWVKVLIPDILISISELDSLSSSKCVLLSTWIFHKDDLVDLHDVVRVIFLTILSVVSPPLNMILSGKSGFIM